MHTKHKGNIAEAFVVAAFLEKGWDVAIPVGELSRYDIIVDRGYGLERVQVKYVTDDNGSIKIPLYSLQHNLRNGQANYRKTRYTAEEIDLIAAWCSTNRKIYLIDINSTKNKTTIKLRTCSSKNGQIKNTHNACDYEI